MLLMWLQTCFKSLDVASLELSGSDQDSELSGSDQDFGEGAFGIGMSVPCEAGSGQADNLDKQFSICLFRKSFYIS